MDPAKKPGFILYEPKLIEKCAEMIPVTGSAEALAHYNWWKIYIITAVTFLSDKKIQNQDPKLLRRFLLKKGLTEEEADIAFNRHEQLKKQNVIGDNRLSLEQPFGPPPPFLPPPPPVPSLWHTTHSIITAITSIGGILFAVYWLWKTYISPYFFGRKPKRKPVETSLAELEAAVGTCVADVKTIRSSLDTLAEQKTAELTQGVVVTRLQEVKSEINSLKGLLLNRNQFPAAPVPVGSGPLSIPAWQLNVEGTELSGHEREAEVEEEGNGSNGNTNGSDSSLEIVRDPNN